MTVTAFPGCLRPATSSLYLLNRLTFFLLLLFVRAIMNQDCMLLLLLSCFRAAVFHFLVFWIRFFTTHKKSCSPLTERASLPDHSRLKKWLKSFTDTGGDKGSGGAGQLWRHKNIFKNSHFPGVMGR
uniref:Uncharacterized protein n=1 Tax=Rhipicephalus microplus TaxID=6941 RepID=A0A6M2D8P0_RHIMP